MTTHTSATAEIEKWLRFGFSQIFDSGSESKTQNPAGVDSASGATSDRDKHCWSPGLSDLFFQERPHLQ